MKEKKKEIRKKRIHQRMQARKNPPQILVTVCYDPNRFKVKLFAIK